MAYIGKVNKTESTLGTQTMDTMTGNGSTATMDLTTTPADVKDVSVYYDGVMQTPGVDYTLSGNTVTFTTAPPNNVYVCCLQTANGDIGTPANDSVTTAKLTDGMFTNSHIPSLSANKLTGALPALDGSALTGVGSGFMENASDPAIDTNPANGLGAVWVNTTSGEIFICTDATNGANVWTNVGAGSDGVVPYVYTYYGTEFGYVAGGSSSTNDIGRFSLTSQTDAADVGDLTQGRGGTAGGKSATHGFVQGDGAAAGHSSQIEKFAYASSANGANHGNMTQAHNAPAEASMETHIYTMGGDGAQDNLIQKTATATDSDATNIGTLVNSIWYVGGNSSTTHGYCAGGYPSNNVIQKFSFTSRIIFYSICSFYNCRIVKCS